MSGGEREALQFEAFRIDAADEQLLRDGTPLPLTRKAFGVLLHLARRPGRLVTKEQLLSAVWPDVIVGDDVLKTAVREVRKTLDDDAREPRFIATAHGRGYRFVAAVRTVSRPAPATEAVALSGREHELGFLQRALADAHGGQRRTVCVSGARGIGKTSLVRAFLATIGNSPDTVTALGQCVDLQGLEEPYMPVLDALGRLARDERVDVRSVLARHAPTWLAQMPSLLDESSRRLAENEALGASRQRALREIAEALDALATDRTVVLVIEDLHWSDAPTLDLLRVLARRPDPARLLVVGTHRDLALLPETAATHRQALGELRTLESCAMLELGPLDTDSVREYVVNRFGADCPEPVARALRERTDGLPLFLVQLVDDLAARGALRAAGGRIEGPPDGSAFDVPAGIRSLVEQQVDRLTPDDRRMLEGASVAGVTFPVAACAAVLDGEDLEVAELRCDRLARRGILRPVEPDPGAPPALESRYAFAHGYYRDVLYDALPIVRRRRMHLAVGEAIETASEGREERHAGELALHFETGRDAERAIRYLRVAAQVHGRRHANREALDVLGRALDLLSQLDAARQAVVRCELLQQRALVQRAAGDMHGATRDLEDAAREARTHDLTDLELLALPYLASVQFWVDSERAEETVQHALALVPHARSELIAHHVRGYFSQWRLSLSGWTSERAAACEAALEAVRRSDDDAMLGFHLVRTAYPRMQQGLWDEAADMARDGVAAALRAGDVHDVFLGQFFGAWAELFAGRWQDMLATVRSGQERANKNGHRLWGLLFRIEESQLREHAGEPARALELAEQAVQARETKAELGQLAYHGTLAVSAAQLGSGDAALALDRLLRIGARRRATGWPVDWLLRAPLHLVTSRAALACGEHTLAGRHARAVVELGRGSGDRTHEALGFDALARVAAAVGARDDAGEQLARAERLAVASRSPVVELALLATRAAFAARDGETALAEELTGRHAARLASLRPAAW